MVLCFFGVEHIVELWRLAELALSGLRCPKAVMINYNMVFFGVAVLGTR